jgi:hypothetical protein
VLKIGIWKASQDTPGQRLWRRGSIAASILGDDACAAPGRFERIMRTISLSNRVARTTFPGRFAGLDAAVQACLKTEFRPDQPLAVEDWAVSSGITAAEWFACLSVDFPRVRFVASDAAIYIWELRRPKDVYILQSEGTPIQYLRPPFVVSLVQKHSWVYPVNRRLQLRALHEWERIAPQIKIPEGEDFDASTAKVPAAFELRRLPLIHPAVLALRNETFRVQQHSVFSPLPEPADLIRTMNILNRAYFSDAQIREAIAAVDRSLKPGGIWIVGRTLTEQPPQHDATVYQKQAGGWKALLRIGRGSEIEPLVEVATQGRES